MIAAAMVSQDVISQKCIDLARNQAVVERTIDARSFTRLAELAQIQTAIAARFDFALDTQQRVVASIDASTALQLPCHWCLQAKPYALQLAFTVLVAASEEQALAWSQAHDAATAPPIVVLAGGVFDPVELLEDELLLQLPGQVCTDQQCADRPANSYADGIPAELTVEVNPFDVLKSLNLGAKETGKE